MENSTDRFWKCFDRDMERLNTAYIKMSLDSTVKGFDTHFADYITALRACTARALDVYTTIEKGDNV